MTFETIRPEKLQEVEALEVVVFQIVSIFSENYLDLYSNCFHLSLSLTELSLVYQIFSFRPFSTV